VIETAAQLCASSAMRAGLVQFIGRGFFLLRVEEIRRALVAAPRSHARPTRRTQVMSAAEHARCGEIRRHLGMAQGGGALTKPILGADAG